MLSTNEDWQKALAQRHGASNQQKIHNATVAVCGLGGLGSNIAVCLARAGIGKLILIDYDKVELANLHRQQYKFSQIGHYKANALSANLQEINPYVKLETHITRITENNATTLLNEADVICEAFDVAENKAMLANYVLEYMPEKCLISASGMSGFFNPNTVRTLKIGKRFFLCGDSVSDCSDGIGPISSGVMLCAAHQAQTALRILTSIE